MIGGVLGIFGVGLLGGSIGLRARRNGAYVIGWDCDAPALEMAQHRGAIDAIAERDELYRRAGVVVLAAHLESTLDELARLAGERVILPELILDVSSVKGPVVAAARKLKNFVATHPLAGSERKGVAAARADLFAGRSWAYVPTGDTQLDRRADEFIRWCGGNPIPTEAEEHDRIVALTSHLPQIMAACYSALLREPIADARQLSGPVARELLRIAGMNAEMWGPILKANAHNIAPHLRRLASGLHAAADAISATGSDRYGGVIAKR